MTDPREVSDATPPPDADPSSRAAGPTEPGRSVADGRPRQLDPRSIQLQRIAGLIATAAFSMAGLVGVLILLFSASGTRTRAAVLLGAWLLTSVVGAALALVWPPLHYRYTTYRVDDRGFQIRSGVWWRSTVDVPHSRVQHTDVQQGPIERSFGLATLIIHTAGTQHAAIPLSGLEHGVALRIRDYLLEDDVRRPDDA